MHEELKAVLFKDSCYTREEVNDAVDKLAAMGLVEHSRGVIMECSEEDSKNVIGGHSIRALNLALEVLAQDVKEGRLLSEEEIDKVVDGIDTKGMTRQQKRLIQRTEKRYNRWPGKS